MYENDFSGKNGFIWFTGIVEGRADPAKVGRIRVRIFGWHSENKNELPTEDLPWAQVLLPVNNSKHISLPKEGEWVSGYFLDGNNGQYPVIFGVYPGIAPTTKNTITATQPPNSPKPPSEVVDTVAGEPTVARQGRGVLDGTMIAKNNKDLAHVCDFVSEMQKNINLKKFLKAVANKIREAIRAVMKALGVSDATGQYSWLIDKLKAFAREVKRIQKEIVQPILDFQKYVLAYVTKLRALIQWILGLPERFLAMLQECLSRLLKLVRSVFTDVIASIKDEFSVDDGGLDEVIEAAKEAATATTDLIGSATEVVTNTAGIVVSATAGLLVPVSEEELAQANKTITDYTSSVPTGTQVQESQQSPTEGKTQP